MLFTFWTGSQLKEPEAVAVWRERFPDFRMFEDEDVLPLLDRDSRREIFERIRIPACKSDIARLVLLREHGGLYVDSHMGPSNGDRLAETLHDLSRFDLILFSQGWNRQFNFMNGVLAARRRAPVLDLLIEKAFDNLLRQKRHEEQSIGHVPYDVYSVTGTYVIVECVFEKVGDGYRIRKEFEDVVGFHVMPTKSSPGFHIYQYYSYRRPGDHWSERQRHERLFH